MTETFAALLFAHALADFVLQTRWIAENKRRLPVLLLHGAVVLATAQAALGRVDAWELLVLAALHIATDGLKSRLAAPGLGAFLADQGAHLAAIAALAALRPDLWAGGLWGGLGWLPALMALLAGAVLAIRAGGFAVGLLMRPWADDDLPRGLTNGGTLIGLLERGLIFLLVMVGQSAGVGFLVAAKSVLRFETTSKDQRAGEYVIIGTLASFGWALLAAHATLALMAALPPIGIPAATP
ncbi:MAG: DUF3307 domain-containing protein [Alphaproteobacteria bacterium HGW-Alphaproteobacteria-6]|nr:MAG: DUF3307 domain-containing protein [Alphaproteobacteria bacterium HGW-Alphaproteobacteria-6]